MKSFLATSLLAVTVLAQSQYAIDPNSVSNSTRQFWCQDQVSQCPLICLDQGAGSGTTEANDCSADSLTYSCVCDNGLSPNVSEYSQTLPYYICTEWGSQCVSNCGSDNTCASNCRQDHPCGALNPTRQNTSTLTRTSTTASSETGAGGAQVTTNSDGQVATVYTGFGGQATSTAAGGNGNGGIQSSGVRNVRVWALGVGQTFGTVGLIGAATLGFAVLL